MVQFLEEFKSDELYKAMFYYAKGHIQNEEDKEKFMKWVERRRKQPSPAVESAEDADDPENVVAQEEPTEDRRQLCSDVITYESVDQHLQLTPTPPKSES